MRLLRDQRGFMLPDLLISMVIMTLIIGATLTTFEGFNRNHRRTQLQNEVQERTRLATDRLAREMRNHWLEKATADDVVGESVNGGLPANANERKRERVRYCLDRADTANVKLVREVQRWTEPPTPTMASTTACPGAGWNSSEVVADHVTNGASRAAFRFDATSPEQIREVRTELFVDVEPTKAPNESRLSGGVFLRNQNRAPSLAVFDARSIAGSKILLNGSFSADPDNDVLSFSWLDAGTPIAESLLKRNGSLAEYGPVSSGNHSISLIVRDPAGLERTAAATVVAVP